MNLLPSRAAEQIGVSVQTLRRWSGVFAAALSPEASPPKGQRRSYTPSDMLLFRHAQELLASGRSVEETANILQTVELDTEAAAAPSAETLPATVDQFAGFERMLDHLSQLADQKVMIERQASEIDDLRRRLDALEGRERRTLWDLLRKR